MAHGAPLSVRTAVWFAVALGACAAPVPPLGSVRRSEDVLDTALVSPIAAHRAVAIDAIGAAGLTDRLEVARRGATDADPLVKAAALRARLRLEPAAVAESLRTWAAGPDAADQLRALAAADGECPPALYAEIVESAAKSDHAEVRRAALTHLGPLDATTRRRVVARALGDQDEAVRVDGIHAAFEHALADPLPRLLDELMMGAAERRAQAARLLGEVGEVSAIPALFHVAAEDSGIVGPTARASLCRLGVDAECARLRASVLSREVAEAGPAISALAAVGGPVAVDALTAAVAHPEPDVRRAVALALSSRFEPALLRLLVPLLDDDRTEPRALAAAALVELEPARALAAVDAAVRGGNPGLRDQLVQVLAERYAARGGVQCAAALSRLAHLSDGFERLPLWAPELPTVVTALTALLSHGDQQTRGLAADAALRSATPELRFLAAHAVATGQVDDPGQALVEATDDPVPAVRIVAAAARLRLARSGMMPTD